MTTTDRLIYLGFYLELLIEAYLFQLKDESVETDLFILKDLWRR